jgi:hypothetical protein
MLDNIEGLSLLAIMEILGPIVLAAAMIYGTMQWHYRRKGRRDPTETTEQNIKEGRLPPSARPRVPAE